MPETTYVEYRLPLDRVGRRTAIMSLPADLSLEEYGRLQGILRALAFGPAPSDDNETAVPETHQFKPVGAISIWCAREDRGRLETDPIHDPITARYPEEDSRA